MKCNYCGSEMTERKKGDYYCFNCGNFAYQNDDAPGGMIFEYDPYNYESDELGFEPVWPDPDPIVDEAFDFGYDPD